MIMSAMNMTAKKVCRTDVVRTRLNWRASRYTTLIMIMPVRTNLAFVLLKRASMAYMKSDINAMSNSPGTPISFKMSLMNCVGFNSLDPSGYYSRWPVRLQ